MLARGLVLTSFAVVLGSVVACVGGPGSLPGQAIGEESSQGSTSTPTEDKSSSSNNGGGASDPPAPADTTSSSGGPSTCVVGSSCAGCPTGFVGTVSACDGAKATCRCVAASARDGG